MNNDFPRIITFLRKERGLSQKQAAADLGISQAVLSHYEKGIRECGLDFLVRTADYYEVSVDYLLGRTVQRNPEEATEQAHDNSDLSPVKGNMINQINRRLLINTTSVIYDLLAQMGSKRLTNTLSNYLMCAHYQVFRAIYGAEKTNAQTMFSLDSAHYKNLTTASMMMDLEAADTVIDREKPALSLSPDIISSYFDKNASSLFNLIQFSERNVRNHHKTD